MSKVLAISLAAAAAITPTGAMAWDRFSQSVTVNVLEPYMDGQFIVQFTSAGVAVNLCSAPPQNTFPSTWGLVVVGTPFPNPDGTNRVMSADGVKQLFATLLTAKLSGRPVNVYANNNPTAPTTQLCVIGVVDLL